MFKKSTSRSERRNHERRAFQSYIQFRNDLTGELVGDLADISMSGFRLEGSRQVALNQPMQFRVDVPPEIPGKGSMLLVARSRWIRPHPVDPRLFVSGYEMERVDPVDSRLYRSIFDKYGTSGPVKYAGQDYLWKD